MGTILNAFSPLELGETSEVGVAKTVVVKDRGTSLVSVRVAAPFPLKRVVSMAISVTIDVLVAVG